MRCPKCGAASLYRDDDGLACLCGYRKYDSPAAAAPVAAHDTVGWWAALGTRPEVVIGKARELSSAMLTDGATPAELLVAVELVRLRLASEFHLELTPGQQKNLRGYLTHSLG